MTGAISSQAPLVTPSFRSPASASTPGDSLPRPPIYRVLAVVGQDTGQVIVRSGPGTSFPVVARLSVGEGAPVVGRTPETDWWKVDLGGTTAWVYAPLVKIEGNPAGVPIVATPIPLTP